MSEDERRGERTMGRHGMFRLAGGMLGMVWLASAGGVCLAQHPAGVAAGVQYLRAHATGQHQGETAMIALGLIKAETPAADPTLQACVAKIKGRFSTSAYEPELTNGTGVYEAAAVAMVLANLDAEGHRAFIQLIAAYLLGQQKANGSWDYTSRTAGDASISQYAILGLWEAANAGIDVPPNVWDRAASWYLSDQSDAGGWCYHRDEPGHPDTLSMTAAGAGSLLICQRQLQRYRAERPATSKLLKPLVTEGIKGDYKPSNSNASINSAVNRGMSWISANFNPANTTVVGQTPYYMLYGLERIGALSDKQTLGRLDWYAKGRAFIESTQHPDGSWSGAHGSEMNTVWAILFLTKSTAKTIQRVTIRRLGAGTLLGGRGLPKDLSSMTVAGGRVVSRPMNGAVEGMLAVLEDPRAEQSQAAVSGLVDRYFNEGPKVLKPHKQRFRRMLSERDPSLRRVAVWALSRMGDFDVIPNLIDALTDPEEEVVAAAKLGLMLVSRKSDGLGPPSPSTPEERKLAVERWHSWYRAIRPLDQEGEDDGGPTAVEPAASAPVAEPKAPGGSAP